MCNNCCSYPNMKTPNIVKVWKLGLTSYDTAFKIQHALSRRHLDSMLKGHTCDPNVNHDTLLFVEHKPVYTAGIRDQTSKDEIARLNALGAEFRKTNRGGLMTFHGPGQLVAYPILNLKHFRTSVKWYVQCLEETVMRLCNDLGFKAHRSPYTGVWVEDNKIAAIGIHASRYVTTHGIALNCNNDLTWFDHIDPCGFDDKGVTSISKETGLDFTVEKVMPLFIKSFEKVLDCKCEDLSAKEQEEILSTVYNKLLTDSETVSQMSQQ